MSYFDPEEMNTPYGDGRYYWLGNASGVTGNLIGFVGGSAYLTGTASLQWTILQAANDGSYPSLTYSTAGGVSTTVALGRSGHQPCFRLVV